MKRQGILSNAHSTNSHSPMAPPNPAAVVSQRRHRACSAQSLRSAWIRTFASGRNSAIRAVASHPQAGPPGHFPAHEPDAGMIRNVSERGHLPQSVAHLNGPITRHADQVTGGAPVKHNGPHQMPSSFSRSSSATKFSIRPASRSALASRTESFSSSLRSRP